MLYFIPVSKFKRCPLLPSKIKLTRTIRTAKSITQRIHKHQTSYLHKTLEIIFNTETPLLPTLSNFVNVDLFTEILLFFIFRDDFDKILKTKKNINMLIVLIDIVLYRIIVPAVVHYILFVINHKFFHFY